MSATTKPGHRVTSFDVAERAGVNQSTDGGPALFVGGDTRTEQGRRSALSLIESGREFDGIFCSCDTMAFGCLRHCGNKGSTLPVRWESSGSTALAAARIRVHPLQRLSQTFDAQACYS